MTLPLPVLEIQHSNYRVGSTSTTLGRAKTATEHIIRQEWKKDSIVLIYSSS